MCYNIDTWLVLPLKPFCLIIYIIVKISVKIDTCFFKVEEYSTIKWEKNTIRGTCLSVVADYPGGKAARKGWFFKYFTL